MSKSNSSETPPRPPKRFGLLVGVDYYQSDGTRSTESGDPVSLSQLRGCVNDVQAVQKVLHRRFGIRHLRVLTSAAPTQTATGHIVPVQHRSSLPTFENIEKQFDGVYAETQEGDVFFFYFSGHGAELKITSTSPKDGRTTDPSLMTFDFCCSQPALRGWQLNSWLKRLHKKGVQVIVILDSCHSGGSWRDDISYRTPDNWALPPNLQVDEDAAQSTVDDNEEEIRDSRGQKVWGMNPEGFTLMTACRVDQVTSEGLLGSPPTFHGFFTYELLEQLNNSQTHLPSYRILRDRIAQRIRRQEPQVFGRDRLTFFGNTEPISDRPLAVYVDGNYVIVPMGKIHGIQPGTRFVSCVSAQPFSIEVTSVNEVQSRQMVVPGVAQYFKSNDEVILSSPDIGPNPFHIVLDSNLWATLATSLKKQIASRLSGPVRCIQAENSSTMKTIATGSGPLRDRQLAVRTGRDSGIDVFGPQSLLGYPGIVRGLALTESTVMAKSKMLAIYLAHLVRFAQILDLRNHTSRGRPRFYASVGADQATPWPESQDDVWDASSCKHGQVLQYDFDNLSDMTLYVTVLNLAPGFGVFQLWPPSSSEVTVPSSASTSFRFEVTVPDRLKGYEDSDGPALHRDIIRTIVTSAKGVSFKGLEMHNIWDATACENAEMEPTLRDGRALTDAARVTWWVEDIELGVRYI